MSTEVKKERVYISGPMTGIPEYNFPEFEKAEAFLRAQGFEPVSPHRVKPHQFTPAETAMLDIYGVTKERRDWLAYILVDLLELVTCQRIYMLHNWRKSPGANIEFEVANRNHLKIDFQHSEEAVSAKH